MNDHRNIKACPRCGGRDIEIEDYDGDFVYIYCHDCEDSIEIPQKGARHPRSEYAHSVDDNDDKK